MFQANSVSRVPKHRYNTHNGRRAARLPLSALASLLCSFHPLYSSFRFSSCLFVSLLVPPLLLSSLYLELLGDRADHLGVVIGEERESGAKLTVRQRIVDDPAELPDGGRDVTSFERGILDEGVAELAEESLVGGGGRAWTG